MSECNAFILQKSTREEELRRKENYKQFKTLFDLFLDLRPNYNGDFTTEVLDRLESNKKLVVDATNAWKTSQDATFAFKTNKNAEISDCAISLVKKHGLDFNWSYIESNFPIQYESKAALGGRKSLDGAYEDIQGSSLVNCLQVAVFTGLTILTGKNNLQEMDDLSNLGIYDVSTSPLIQTASLPRSSKAQHDLYEKFKNSLFFHEGELLFFTLGYAFGGSRQDSKYYEKELRAEDCTSAVAKWLGAAAPFATSHMKVVHQQKGCDLNDAYCKAVESTLLPKDSSSLEHVNPGDIYAFAVGGHAGVVVSVINSTCFESLSYSRNVPEIEGLGYGIDCPGNREGGYLFFEPICSAEQLGVIPDCTPTI